MFFTKWCQRYGRTNDILLQFFVSAKLAVVGLATVPPVALLGVVYGKFLKQITEKILNAWAESTQVRRYIFGGGRADLFMERLVGMS